MTVYVDTSVHAFGRMLLSHMLADSDEELHAMADAIGVDRRHWQHRTYSHYDICQTKRKKALRLGARVVSMRELGQILQRQREGRRAAQVLQFSEAQR